MRASPTILAPHPPAPSRWRTRTGSWWTSPRILPNGPESLEMKITGIETLVCHARMRNWIFVKVLTDQPGLYGWGEATLEWHTRAVVGAIEDLSQLVIGEDPARVEHLW